MSVNREYDAKFFGLISRVSPWYQFKLSLKYFKRLFYDIWWFRGSDYNSTLKLLEVSLKEQLRVISTENVEGYDETEETRLPKEKAIKRCVEILNNIREDDYAERCGYDYNYDVHFKDLDDKPGYSEMLTTATDEQKQNNRLATNKSMELEQNELDELCELIRDPQNGIKTWWK